MKTLATRFALTALLIAGFQLSAVGCGVPKEEHQRVLAQKKRLESQLAEMRKLSAAQKAQLATLEKDLKRVKGEFQSQLAAKHSALQKRLAELAKTRAALEELEKIKAEMEARHRLDAQLRSQLQAMISAGKLQVVNVNGRLVIKMASKILFRSGRANLTRKGRRYLSELAGILKRIDRHFQVAGHTDNVPTHRRRYKDNWNLSAARAAKVVRLLQKHGVPGKNLSAAGFGQFQPIASNRTRAGKALNRRIEITLLPVIPPQVRH